MKRRRLLGAAAGCCSLGGCLSQAGSDPETAMNDTDEDGTTTDTSTTTDYGDALVRDVTVTPELVAANSPDSIGTFGAQDEQFVVATVAAEGLPAPPRDAFALDAGEESYSPSKDSAGMNYRLWNDNRPYGESTEGWIAFSASKPLDAEAVTITWPDSEHALNDDAVAQLTRPPTEFEVREFAAPDSIAYDESVTVTLTVENVGDTDGTFVGAFNRSGPSIAYTPEEAISLDVAAGETASWEYTNAVGDRSTEAGGDDPTMRFLLNWRDGDRSQSIAIETSR